MGNSVETEHKLINENSSEDYLARNILLDKYKRVRSFSEYLCETLETEDYVIQTMPDVSPAKWHLAHTSWFFEAFLLKEVYPNYVSINPEYDYLFNSYYVQIGERFFRPHRGLLSRPTVKQVFEFRNFIDENMFDFFDKAEDRLFNKFALVIEIGLNHEQQHQELLLTDIKHVLSVNPLKPVFHESKLIHENEIPKIYWKEFESRLTKIGSKGDGFFYDNEQPRHKEFIQSFQIASRLITNKEYIEFIEDGSYSNPLLWLSDGYAAVETNKWNAPLYWEKKDDEWWYFTLSGFRKVNPDEPVCHVSLYEADAFARWAGARLAAESEWEVTAESIDELDGNFVDNGFFHTIPAKDQSNENILQFYGDVWEWTQSDYRAYPGYKIPSGAIGEYNGKFMSGQNVLRGGSCATSKDHMRITYRNFFPPGARWQFSGIRLAKDLKEVSNG